MITTIAAPQPWQPLQWCEQLRCELLASEHISPWHRGEVVNARRIATTCLWRIATQRRWRWCPCCNRGRWPATVWVISPQRRRRGRAWRRRRRCLWRRRRRWCQRVLQPWRMASDCMWADSPQRRRRRCLCSDSGVDGVSAAAVAYGQRLYGQIARSGGGGGACGDGGVDGASAAAVADGQRLYGQFARSGGGGGVCGDGGGDGASAAVVADGQRLYGRVARSDGGGGVRGDGGGGVCGDGGGDGASAAAVADGQ